ncbi:hypothetical protein [Paraburkholderia flagellata]|uniref:hypothetical protein n=1 Tax=Paraburkholderia flagellata TaxID=2883241 RepID=UPI001F37F552|nr:hypothetical protein [Paraburkholderia flagellata]
MTGTNPLVVGIFFGTALLRGYAFCFASLRAGLPRRYQPLLRIYLDASRMERHVRRG